MKQRGVTLIQMMFGLAMAALLTQLGMPAYSKWSDDLHRTATARDLAQSLRSARSHAMLQGQAVLVQSVEDDWGKGWRVVLENNRQLLREHRLSRAQRIDSNMGNQVKFSAQGIPLGATNNFRAGRLEVCKPTAVVSQYQLVLASSGRVDLRTDEPKHPLCAGP
ncbi:GspH/FimT family pseudopilin [Pseudomonas sp. PSKL.D1]|uniref:GspH/FimT family pseudopilin n=1 Tax=Pseudomonas sp. PSKL.D1 TaxID=3029060 RepID=UPI00238177C9|nr:GspH/FimT family pseudopilin [Pseudomonas sp. PSKL.D1]WDY57389.1 GspH/FimT family pseudopilin [Pseudomonas sp. PSKL.D1]